MNSLLIVDDEVEILEWLEELFRYEAGMDIDVYTVTSAFEALELLNKIRFEVVLSDIRMPGMDGIQLHSEIKKNWPSCQVVFLSAYRNFDYMYELCLHNQDIQYVLKSEKDEVIVEAVEKAFRKIKDMLNRRMEEEEQRILLEYARQKRQQDILHRLIYPVKGKGVTKKEMDEAGLRLNSECPVIAFLVRLDGNGRLEDGENLLMQALALIENFAPRELGFYSYRLSDRYSAVLAQPYRTEQIHWQRIYAVVYGAVEYAQINFQKTEKAAFSVVISSAETRVDSMGSRIFWLRKIMAGNLGDESSVIVHAESLHLPAEGEDTRDYSNVVERMKQNMRLLRRREYFEELDICCAKLGEYASKHDMEALSLYYGMAMGILQFITEKNLNQKLSFHIGLYKLLEVGEHATWNEAGQYLLELSEKIFEILGVAGEDNLNNQIMDRLLRYMDEHLDQDLTLIKLAEFSGFNASYLSRLFKQMKGTTISEYILMKRMELAKVYLGTSNEMVKTIAQKTGYPSAQSFGRAFRNYTGASPQEYRMRIGIEK